MKKGRACCSWLLASDATHLWDQLANRMQTHFEGADGLGRFLRGVSASLGQEAHLDGERVEHGPGGWVYSRTATFSAAGSVVLEWQIDDEGRVSAMHLLPAAAAGVHPRTELRLPFEGEWSVTAGGLVLPGNAHFRYPEDVFGVDLEPVDRACLGRPILAPAGGVVVSAVDDLADNAPGRRNPARWEGNHVVLEHEGGERSVLAHLQSGSVAVRPGERVAAGAPLGRCGNSGGARSPHLHYHLEDAGHRGIPAEFTGYLADGAPVERAALRYRQTVRAR